MKLKELINLLSKEDVEKLYCEYNSLRKIGELYNASPQTITRLMDHYEIKRNDKNLGNKSHFFNESYFENIDNQDKAYWLGFIMADGCIYEGTNNTLRLQINLKYDDVSHLNKFQDVISSDYTIQRKSINNSVAALLKINSTKMCNDLIKHGVIIRKSLKLEFPNINENLYSHFIRGYFDGDGCISFSINERMRKEFSIVGNTKFIEQLSLILDIKYYKIKDREYLSQAKSCDKESILRIYEYLYNNANTFLQRKKRNYEILVYILRCPLME